MRLRHTVRQGDCLASIAFQHGFHPDTLWNHPDNAALKRLRGDPNVLLPGDVVSVPDTREKSYPCATTRSHRFRRRGVPEKLKLTVRREAKPRAGEGYVLVIDGAEQRGTTDAEGRIEHWIAPDARRGTLRFEVDGASYELLLGHLDPIEELSGVQGRLKSLGFYHGPIDGKPSQATDEAVSAFQASSGLDPDAGLDDLTRGALRDACG
jgi:hypothetical protein